MSQVARSIAKAQKAYRNDDWDEYDAFVANVSYLAEISYEEAYTLVEEGPLVFEEAE